MMSKLNRERINNSMSLSENDNRAASIEATLAERGKRYGDFAEHARITQNIKKSMQDSFNWKNLPDDMKETLEMVAHKIGRILNGDPYYMDSWHDAIGYLILIEKRYYNDTPKN